MFKVNKKDTRTTNFEHILHFALVFLLVTLRRYITAGTKVRVEIIYLSPSDVIRLVT